MRPAFRKISHAALPLPAAHAANPEAPLPESGFMVPAGHTGGGIIIASTLEEGRSCAVRLSRNQSLRRERALPPNQRIMTMSDNVNKSGLATAGFVLGVISLLAWLLPIIGVPIAIMAFSFGLKCSETPTIIMSVIGLVIGAINATIGAMMFY